MIKIQDTHGRELGVAREDEETIVNFQTLDWDITPLGHNLYHIIRRHKSYLVEILGADLKEKTFQIKVNHNAHTLKMRDRVDLLLERLGMNDLNAQAVTDLKAPMPGLIVDVLVKEGDQLQKGQPVAILEAMKMENMLKATGEGKVKFISVTKGDRVEKNQVLIHFE